MPPCRILQLTSTSDVGGAERMVLWLADTLDKRKFTVHIASLIGSGKLITQAAAAGIPATHFKFRHPADPAGMVRLVRYIRREKIELVQTHGLRADSIARWAVRLAGARAVVSTIHSIDPWRRWQHSALDRLTSPFVSRFVAVCDAAKRATIQREGITPDKIDVVYIGLPPRDIPRENRDAIRVSLDISQGSPIVGILANLRDMKGHAHVINALPAILEQNPDAVFLFAGRDDSHGRLQLLAKQHKVDHAIRFLGFVEDTTTLLAAMDIFLLPSDWEGLPVSILEAMHAGVPIIATRVGGIPELIRNEEDGLLIEPAQPAQIAESVNRMARDWPLRARLARSADARAQAEFSVSRMAARMESIYEELLKEHHRPSLNL